MLQKNTKDTNNENLLSVWEEGGFSSLPVVCRVSLFFIEKYFLFLSLCSERHSSCRTFIFTKNQMTEGYRGNGIVSLCLSGGNETFCLLVNCPILCQMPATDTAGNAHIFSESNFFVTKVIM
ncbi:hypothetical protein ILYODFUR_008818 [Ilyodon furcidens]|uniref:Uncharacterized protein n=1 Tax=Ilyodon furcidens TaxID=33524 RepID=A0ABV0T7T5_9TELE